MTDEQRAMLNEAQEHMDRALQLIVTVMDRTQDTELLKDIMYRNARRLETCRSTTQRALEK